MHDAAVVRIGKALGHLAGDLDRFDRRDRALLHALALAYGPLLDKGRYPMAALFLELPGADLDINVHPQKLEVRFARAQEVYAAVRHVVGGASDHLSRAPFGLRTYDCVSCLNRKHMSWAWASLFGVGFADLYVRLCSMGVWTDWRLL